MREGMLWFDNSDQRDLAGKIERAAQYYTTKYGSRPTLCYVHPSALLNQKLPITLEGIEVRATNSVITNHFWLGIDDKPRRTATS